MHVIQIEGEKMAATRRLQRVRNNLVFLHKDNCTLVKLLYNMGHVVVGVTGYEEGRPETLQKHRS